MHIARHGGDGYAANGYCITDDAVTTSILVDPALPPERLPTPAAVQMVILTHAHFDHMLAVDAWRAKGIPLAIHGADAPALGDADRNVFRLFTGQEGGTAPAERLLAEKDTLPLGAEHLTVLHTPGHTPGSLCLLGDGFLVTGDTLFAGTIGRTDLPGGDDEQMSASLARLREMPDDLLLYPGHGPASSIEREKRYNPYME